jgi:hypothetical protein
MSDDGTTKDDVKVPDNEVGEKVKKLFHDDGTDTSELEVQCIASSLFILTIFRRHRSHSHG